MAEPVPQLLARAASRLTDAGVATPRVDAELLLAHVLGEPRSRLVSAPPPSAAAAARYAELVECRAARVPLQHLTGTAPFRYLELAVGPGVFIPRPETELLVDLVLPERPGTAVDLCSGSGAIALAIAHELPGTAGYAVECAEEALGYLRRNAEGTAVTVVDGDVRDPGLLAELRGIVDVVVSNPPYVPSSTPVDPEVRADPVEAVFAGTDGLDLIPAVLARAAELLRPGGLLVMEHDASHGSSVPGIVRSDARWTDVADHPDLADRPRFVSARRCGPPR
jgi:release factor glutamine methyltransferase